MLEAIVIWGVIWLLGATVGTYLIVGAGVLGAAFVDSLIPLILGWIAAVIFWGFAVVQVVLHVVALIQYLT